MGSGISSLPETVSDVCSVSGVDRVLAKWSRNLVPPFARRAWAQLLPGFVVGHMLPPLSGEDRFGPNQKNWVATIPCRRKAQTTYAETLIGIRAFLAAVRCAPDWEHDSFAVTHVKAPEGNLQLRGVASIGLGSASPLWRRAFALSRVFQT
jgi:hypothetical protein